MGENVCVFVILIGIFADWEYDGRYWILMD
jgi:hypothetical protein